MVQMHELSCMNAGETRVIADRLINKLDYLSDEDRLLVYHTAAFMIGKYKTANVRSRDSGDPAYYHPLATAEILANWRLPASSLQEGLLHDTVEDANVTIEELREDFGGFIAEGVDRLGIVKRYDEEARKRGITDDIQRDRELRSLFFESLIDHPSVVLVRAAERLQNLETIKPRHIKNPLSAERTARESLIVYLPFLWDLGMYDVANLYAKYALGVADPDQIEIAGAVLPTINEKISEVRESLAGILGLDLNEIDKHPLAIPGLKSTRLNVYPPNYRDLVNLLVNKRDIRNIKPEEVPYLVDIVVKDGREVGVYFFTLIHSGLFDYHRESALRFLQDLSKPEIESFHLTLVPKTPIGIVPSPIKISFLTEDGLIRRQASLLHLHQVGVVDERLKTAAKERVGGVKERLRQAAQNAPSAPERDTAYIEAIRGDKMVVNYSLRGEVNSVSVKKRSSVMDVLSEALTPGEFIHCKVVKIRGREQPLNQIINPLSRLDIEIDEEDIHLDPLWLDLFRQAEEEKRIFLKRALRNIVDNNPIDLGDGNFLGDPSEYRDRILEGARRRALNNIEKKYMKKRDSVLRLDVTDGFDEELRALYGSDKEKFLVDAGIGAVSEQKIDVVVRNLVDIRNRLIPITLYVPTGQDRPGWQSVFAGVISEAGMNMKILDGGGSNDPGMEMFITYWCEMPSSLPPEGLPAFLKMVKSSVLERCKAKFNLVTGPPLVYEIPGGLQVKEN